MTIKELYEIILSIIGMSGLIALAVVLLVLVGIFF
jgi:hypothetical protein